MRGRPRDARPEVTERQREVARLVADGRTNEQVADALGISLAGAKYHVSELLGRLGLERRDEIAAWYRGDATATRRARRRLGGLAAAPLAWAGAGAATAVAVLLVVVAFDRATGLEDGVAPAPPAERAAREELPGLLLTHGSRWAWDAAVSVGGHRALVTPVDATTARDAGPSIEIPGGTPGWGTVSASPDGELLAVAFRDAGVVTFIELETWAEVGEIAAEPLGLPSNHRIDRLQWVPDGSLLLAWRSHCTSGHCPPDVIDELWAFDPASGTARLVGRYDFWPVDVVATQAGDRVHVLADHGRRDLAAPPDGGALVAIDTATGDVVGEVALPHVATGLAPGMPPFDGPGYASYRPAIAHHGSRVYVVHPDEDRLTVVDVDAMEVVEEVDFGAERPTLSRLGSWLRSQVLREAAAMPAQAWERQAELSPDGRLLLISGSQGGQFACPPGDEASSCSSFRPAGLTVVDTVSLEIVFSEPAVAAFHVTADGRRVLGRVAPHSGLAAADAAADGAEHGILLVDLDALEVRRHLWPDERLRDVTLSPHGSHAYVRTYAPGVIQDGAVDLSDCDDACYILNVVDLASGRVVAERELGAEYGMISLAGR